MKKLLFVFITFCLLAPVRAQTISLSKSHNELPYPPLIVLDGLEISPEDIEEWGIEKHVIKRVKYETTSDGSRGYCGIIRLYSKFLIVLDDELLGNTKEKVNTLSNIKRESISSIKMIDKQDAVRKFGKKGKHGALLIQTCGANL